MVDWNGLDGASDALTAGQGFEHVGRSPEIIRLEEDVSLGIQSRLTPSALNEDNASPSAPNANLEAQGRQLKPVSFVMGCCSIGRRLVGLRVNKSIRVCTSFKLAARMEEQPFASSTKQNKTNAQGPVTL